MKRSPRIGCWRNAFPSVVQPDRSPDSKFRRNELFSRISNRGGDCSLLSSRGGSVCSLVIFSLIIFLPIRKKKAYTYSIPANNLAKKYTLHLSPASIDEAR